MQPWPVLAKLDPFEQAVAEPWRSVAAVSRGQRKYYLARLTRLAHEDDV